MSTNSRLNDAMRDLAALEDPKMREANERRGDDDGLNLTRLRPTALRRNWQFTTDRNDLFGRDPYFLSK
jgi:hypothetical protein